MKALNLITVVIVFFLFSPTRAEYQSNYDPNEEYSCRYSMGSERFSYTENGVAAPFEIMHPFARVMFDKIKESLKNTVFNFKFSVNGDLIRVVKIDSGNKNINKPLKVFFQEVVENNENVIVSHHVDNDEDVFLNTIIFKNDNLVNSVENFHFHEITDGIRKHFSLSWHGRCERVNNI